jgi:hypothetical protein
MKNQLLSLVLVLSMFGCSTKDEPKVQLDQRLVNTKWLTEDSMYRIFFGGECYNVYEFIDDSTLEEYVTRNGIVDKSYGTHKYTLNYPNISIIKNDGKKYDYTFRDSRTVIRNDATNEYASFMKYTKQ